jgi:hypothetical protein
MANGDYDLEEVRSRMHDAVYGMLIEKIRRDHYPSTTMMNMVEAGMTEQHYRAYVGALLEKVADDQFPSPDMLKRITGLV